MSGVAPDILTCPCCGVALITKQLGRAVDGAFDGDAPEYCVAMVRVAALAVAAIQSVRRKAWDEGEQLSARDMSQ